MIVLSVQSRVCPLPWLHSVKDGTISITFSPGTTKPVNLANTDSISVRDLSTFSLNLDGRTIVSKKNSIQSIGLGSDLDFFLMIRISLFAGKFVSPEMVARRVAKSGDGTHPLQQEQHQHNDCVWGYGDADICEMDLRELEQMHT